LHTKYTHAMPKALPTVFASQALYWVSTMTKAVGRQARQEAPVLHLLFVGTALTVALAGGFSLGTLLALARTGTWGLEGRWPAIAQAHGHAQLAGWAGLFIMGMAYRLVPRFASTPAVPLVPALASLVATAGGLAVRVVGQPLATADAGRAVLATAAALELAGAVTFASLLLPRLWAPLRQGRSYAPHLATMVLWLLVVRSLGMSWALGSAANGVALLPFDRQQALHNLEMWGFVLAAVAGVSLRSVIIFFGREAPGPRATWGMWSLLNAGLCLYVLAAAWQTYAPGEGLVRAEALGYVLVGLGLAAPAIAIGPWRPPSRLRPTSRGAGVLVQMGMLWLLAGGLLLAVLGTIALAEGTPVAYARLDAARHVLGVGTVTTMIMGMAYLVMPAFALARQEGEPYRWAVRLALLLLPMATVMRAAGGWLAGDLKGADHLTATAGVLAWLAVAAFAASLARALRSGVRAA